MIYYLFVLNKRMRNNSSSTSITKQCNGFLTCAQAGIQTKTAVSSSLYYQGTPFRSFHFHCRKKAIRWLFHSPTDKKP